MRRSSCPLLLFVFTCGCLGGGDFALRPVPDHPASPEARESAVRLPGTLALDAPQAPAETGRAAATYSCPMHPDVVADRPGTCPHCGMQLQRVAKESMK